MPFGRGGSNPLWGIVILREIVVISFLNNNAPAIAGALLFDPYREIERAGKSMDELSKKILLYVKEHQNVGMIDVRIDGYSFKQISQGIGKLYNSGYLEAIEFSGDDEREWHAERLTSTGEVMLGMVARKA